MRRKNKLIIVSIIISILLCLTLIIKLNDKAKLQENIRNKNIEEIKQEDLSQMEENNEQDKVIEKENQKQDITTKIEKNTNEVEREEQSIKVEDKKIQSNITEIKNNVVEVKEEPNVANASKDSNKADTTDFFYTITNGKVEYSSMDDCLTDGINISFKDTVDIKNYRCYEVISEARTVMGYFLNIICSSENCNDRYKN